MGPEEIEDVMAAEALSESEILAKANKALPDDYTPSDDEEYMNLAEPCRCAAARTRPDRSRVE